MLPTVLAIVLGLSPEAFGNTPERLVFYVDALLGDDAPTHDGSASLPFRTLGYALQIVEELGTLEEGNALAATVFLRPGVYGDTQGAFKPEITPTEKFPLRLPWEIADLLIAVDPSSVNSGERHGGVVIENASEQVPTLGLGSWTQPTELRLCLSQLTLRGGSVGAELLAGRGQTLSVVVDQCVFESSRCQGLALYAGSETRASLTVRGCEFRSALGGISLETGASAQVELVVEGSTIEGLRAYGPAGSLGAGVDLHVDSGAQARARIERSIFRGMASAVQLTAAEVNPDLSSSTGRLVAEVVGNLIVGPWQLPPGQAGGTSMKAALYLSLWPHHEISLTVASNTIAAVDGPVVYHDNLDRLQEGGVAIPLVFVNNICHRIAADSEFDLETALQAGGGSFPPAEVSILNNLLEKSLLALSGEGGNFLSEPCFVDAPGGDYRLQKGSPAVDRGLAQYAEVASVDLDGRCRRTSQECRPELDSYPIDLGAYELGGFCDRETAVFRRGDCNRSGGDLELSDAIYLFGFLFLGGEAPPVFDACDSNDDGRVDITDGIYCLSFLFLGGNAPPPPFDSEGTDPSRDCLQPSV